MVASVVLRIPGSDMSGAWTSKGGNGSPAWNDLVDARAGLEEPARTAGHSQSDVADALFDEPGKADELNGIAQAMFDMQQDRAVRKRIPLPKRLAEMPEA